MDDDVGSLIRRARLEAGLTQVQAAGQAGTTQAMIARYERGSVSPTVYTLKRILAALGQEVELVIRESTHTPLSGPIGRRVHERRREIRRLNRPSRRGVPVSRSTADRPPATAALPALRAMIADELMLDE